MGKHLLKLTFIFWSYTEFQAGQVMDLDEAPDRSSIVSNKRLVQATAGGSLTPTAYHQVALAVHRWLLN